MKRRVEDWPVLCTHGNANVFQIWKTSVLHHAGRMLVGPLIFFFLLSFWAVVVVIYSSLSFSPFVSGYNFCAIYLDVLCQHTQWCLYRYLGNFLYRVPFSKTQSEKERERKKVHYQKKREKNIPLWYGVLKLTNP